MIIEEGTPSLAGRLAATDVFVAAALTDGNG
jgi:hypothetical protein